jgi:hypothetical protein
MLPAAGEDICSKFRATYAGQGYVLSFEDGGQRLQIKVIGQTPTTNRTVVIIRTKPDLWIATGRLLSKDAVVSGTQQVERVAGTLPPKAGDVVFFAPWTTVAGEGSAETGESTDKTPVEPVVPAVSEPATAGSPPAAAGVGSVSVDPPSVPVVGVPEPPAAAIQETATVVPPRSETQTAADSTAVVTQQDFQDWRRDLLASTHDVLKREWISRLDNAIRSWTPGNDFRVDFCRRKLRELEATNETAYLLLIFEYHVKAGNSDAAGRSLNELSARIDATRLEDLRKELKNMRE